MKQKTVIALRGRKNRGKTQTIKKVYPLLRDAFPDARETWIHPESGFPVNTEGDICMIMESGGVSVGIESEGDPDGRLFRSLEQFRSRQPPCEIILCATRTRGKTVQAVERLRPEYRIEWIRKGQHPKNDECANVIVGRIKCLLAEREAHS